MSKAMMWGSPETWWWLPSMKQVHRWQILAFMRDLKHVSSAASKGPEMPNWVNKGGYRVSFKGRISSPNGGQILLCLRWFKYSPLWRSIDWAYQGSSLQPPYDTLIHGLNVAQHVAWEGEGADLLARNNSLLLHSLSPPAWPSLWHM